MHDSHDGNEVGLDSEEDAERERLGETPTDVIFDNWVHGRIEFNPVASHTTPLRRASLNPLQDGSEWVSSKCRVCLGKHIGSLAKLDGPVIHLAAALAGFLTHAGERSSPGLASRLAIKRSATNARAWRDRDSASLMILSAVMLERISGPERCEP